LPSSRFTQLLGPVWIVVSGVVTAMTTAAIMAIAAM